MSSLVFGDFPAGFSEFENADIVILPVPYDGTSTYIKGADKGPRALITASDQLENYDIETGTEPFRVGINVVEPVTEASSPEAMTKAVYQRSKALLEQDKFVILLGGEHSVSFGSIKAHAEKYPEMQVLQFDAHTDLRQEYHGSEHNHACVMARTHELCPITQIGIRSMDVSEKALVDPERIFYAHEIAGQREWIAQMLGTLSDHVYITIDLDVLDPSIMRATGTPEPGGMLWYDLLAALRAVAKQKTIVGFDIVELCPMRDTKADEFLAAKLLYKILAYIYQEDSRTQMR